VIRLFVVCALWAELGACRMARCSALWKRRRAEEEKEEALFVRRRVRVGSRCGLAVVAETWQAFRVEG